MASSNKAFKLWFDRKAAAALAEQVGAVAPRFDRKAFVRRASRGLDKLEFSGRVQQFADALAAGLPTAIPKALKILTDSLPPALDTEQDTTDGYLQWPVGQFIADHGVPHFEPAMTAMIALTQRFSSEFAVRPFVEQRQAETLARLRSLTDHDSAHVRRWCSEGVRPRLPWGKKLVALAADPRPILPILEALKDDPSVYVRRSVANTMGDIAKDAPELAIRRCKAWRRGAGEERRWVIAHALRTLIKRGDAAALAVVGVGPPKGISAALAASPKRIRIGDALTLEATVSSTAKREQKIVVDYVVHYVAKTGGQSRRVFKWKTTALPGRSTLTLNRRHAMRPTTTRSLYPGAHRIVLQINGQPLAEASFRLAAAR